MSSPYNTEGGPSGPGPSFTPSGGYQSYGSPAPQPTPPPPPSDPYAAPYADPYASQPRTNLYGQTVDPYAQHGMSPYGSYGGDSYSVYAYPQRPVKSKATAALLAFFLGGLGIHQFYLGKNGLALGHLALVGIGMVMMVVGAVLGVQTSATGSDSPYVAMAGLGYMVWMANSLWAFVDFIIILTKSESDLGR